MTLKKSKAATYFEAVPDRESFGNFQNEYFLVPAKVKKAGHPFIAVKTNRN